MPNTKGKNKQAFTFYECMNLIRPTGKRARDTRQLLTLINEADPNVIYHHMHRTCLNESIEALEYPNDFAVWAADALEERALAEKLSGLDLNACKGVEEVRSGIANILKTHLAENPAPRPAKPGNDFFFNDAFIIVVPADLVVENVPGFIDALRVVGSSSLYFHFFEARMRLKRPTNDFSTWFDKSQNQPAFAKHINEIDPYHYNLEELRRKVISLLQ